MKRNSILLFAAGIMVLAVSDASAQRNIRHQTRNNQAVSTNSLASVKPRTASVNQIAIDQSDPSGNTVYAGLRRSGSSTPTTSLVQGNYIGTNVRMLNNKNPELTRYGLQARGNDVLMEETTIVHEGIVLSRSPKRIRQ